MSSISVGGCISYVYLCDLRCFRLFVLCVECCRCHKMLFLSFYLSVGRFSSSFFFFSFFFFSFFFFFLFLFLPLGSFTHVVKKKKNKKKRRKEKSDPIRSDPLDEAFRLFCVIKSSFLLMRMRKDLRVIRWEGRSWNRRR